MIAAECECGSAQDELPAVGGTDQARLMFTHRTAFGNEGRTSEL